MRLMVVASWRTARKDGLMLGPQQAKSTQIKTLKILCKSQLTIRFLLDSTIQRFSQTRKLSTLVQRTHYTGACRGLAFVVSRR